MSFSMWLALAAGIGCFLVTFKLLPNGEVPIFLLLLAIFVELREQRRVY